MHCKTFIVDSYLLLDKNGNVKKANFMNEIIPDITNDDLINLHLNDVIKIMKQKKIKRSVINIFDEVVNNYNHSSLVVIFIISP